MSISYGFAVFDPEHPVSSDTLLATADKEMYKMKDSFYEHLRQKRILNNQTEEALKNSNEQLEESTRKWNITFDTIGDGVVLMDAEQNISQCNKSFTDFLGKPFSEIIGRKCYSLVHGSDCPVEGCPFIRTKQSRHRESMEFKLKDHFFNVLVDPIFDENNNIMGAVHIVTDITKHKQMEETLQDNEEKYRALIEHSLQGLVVIQDFGIAFANAAFAEISGYTVKELLSLSPEGVKSMIHPEDQELVWGHFRDRLTGKPVPPRSEYRGIRKNGAVRWLEMFATRIEYHEKPAIQGAVIDITERKKAVEMLRESSQQKYHRILELTSEWIWQMNVEGIHTFSNSAIERILGYKVEEIVGRTYSI